MIGAETTVPTARFITADLIERGRLNTLKCPVYYDSALSEPTAVSITIYDASNVAVETGTPTVTASIAEYEWTPASSLDLGMGWRVEWVLTVEGVTRVFRNEAALVRTQLYPVISDVDIFRIHPDLDPSASGSLVPSGYTFQTLIDEAWAMINNRLIAKGNRPNLIMSPSSLRECHLYMVLEMFCRYQASSAGQTSQWAVLESRYTQKAGEAWNALTFTYDADDDGVADSTARRNGTPSIWLL